MPSSHAAGIFQHLGSVQASNHTRCVRSYSCCTKRGSWTQHTFIFLQFWRSDPKSLSQGQNRGVGRSSFPLVALEKNVSPPSPDSRATFNVFFDSGPPFSSFKASNASCSFSHHIDFFLLSNKDLSDYIWGSPTESLYLKILNLITSAQSDFCHIRWYSQVPGIRTWIFGGPLFSPLHPPMHQTCEWNCLGSSGSAHLATETHHQVISWCLAGWKNHPTEPCQNSWPTKSGELIKWLLF